MPWGSGNEGPDGEAFSTHSWVSLIYSGGIHPCPPTFLGPSLKPLAFLLD